ncbi:MAG TPA: 5-deoxy-glucuronate isomerase [Caulobacteraceae bacterium]
MSKLLVRQAVPDASGCVLDITPASAGWTYVGFRLLRIPAGEQIRGGEAGREACLVVLSGCADITIGARTWNELGGRDSVFADAPPAAVYAPAGSAYALVARTAVELAVCTAPGSPGRTARLIDPASMTREVRGAGTNRRFVRNILSEAEAADSLLVVEVITPGGHWSSWPPHKHDTAAKGQETALEETYYHRLSPPQGFAFQRVYTDDGAIDETVCVHDGDVVLVPRGYHPVGAPHGYDLYYLNVMAGAERRWKFRNDPVHDWIARR